MSFHNYKRASDYEVRRWLEKSIPELTNYQKEKMRDFDFLRSSPFEFYIRRKKVKKVWLRFSIIFFPIVWILIYLSLPFNFILTGSWGYSNKSIKWFTNWINELGL